ncbi:MAG: cyclomaltodextrinase N-terminal domain-containing protein [Candidatus Marinimicrobia bacterium]|nr:cyclomaltodextrinase N-terminal domain-containing protein [Candidatus Neomarinimicrobiota bacterium]
MKNLHKLVLLALCLKLLPALEITHFEPPNWWADMERDTVSVLVYGDDFTRWQASLKSPAARLIDASAYPERHYFNLTLKIRKSGECPVLFTNPATGEKLTMRFPVLPREAHTVRTIDASDVVYLLMPDRFADGDKGNNHIPGHKDPLRAGHRWGRRGGDLRGVMDHLDYLVELGVTALWMTPVYENDYINCYHGYTPTQTYAVDPHLGTTDTYKELAAACRERGIKLIQDHIVNHIAPTHPIAVNPPSPEWLNGSLTEHENCNYRIMDITDVYGSEEQRSLPVKGWFAGYLADMNMEHPPVVDYWIQHAIWWIETVGLDGIRQDTYAYSDLEGLSRWANELKREYPGLFIVGEIMDFDRTRLAYFFNDRQNNYLSSIADFGFSSMIYQLIVENIAPEEFYREVSNDHIYRDPNMMLTFMDNHDMGRFYSAVGGDLSAYLNAYTLLFGMRGIPQIYYGNEIGMSGGHDPENRREFPGGFDNADHNAFLQSGRTDRENRIFDQFRAFTDLRKHYPSLFTGPMRHALLDEVYCVIRRDEGSGTALFLAYNASGTSREVSLAQVLKGNYVSADTIKSPLNGSALLDLQNRTLVLPAKESLMLILK